MRLGEVPEPDLRERDVLVQVNCAIVNPFYAKIRNGELKAILPYRLPLILGNDVAEVVVRVGPKVRTFKPGDEVYARPNQTYSALTERSGWTAGAVRPCAAPICARVAAASGLQNLIPTRSPSVQRT
ncbi:MAG: alcohol dehydrogenase catalytic domain-containing protein, partial [Novosphingobium sp.]|nr:alcohol dehydrogenase catalytic domain-containing protein [Novosphingobium sp.]